MTWNHFAVKQQGYLSQVEDCKRCECLKVMQRHEALGNVATRTAAPAHCRLLINSTGLFTTSSCQYNNRDNITSLYQLLEPG